MPKVSVIILNWNGKRFLKNCLESLGNVQYASLEIILVDNNSSDDSVMWVRKHFTKVKVIANKENNGFAGGNNIGADAATGEYLLFLNNDTRVEPDFLDQMIKDYRKDPHLGCIQPQMRGITDANLLDEAGAYMTPNGFLYHYGYRKHFALPQYRKPRIIFSAKGACMLIPRSVFNAVGKFDEDFFIFFEESDLCYRIWLAGYKVIYEPRSTIFHLAGGDTADKYNYARRIYLTIKNMNMAYLQNFGTRNMLTVYPLFFLTQIMLFGYFIVTMKWLLVRTMLDAWVWDIKHLYRILQKRKRIQNSRVVSDTALNNSIYYNPGLSYYYHLLLHAQKFADTPIARKTLSYGQT